ncbi:uncharacterized protein GGS22DRAFT_73862 [Annulohypoxylon maeteangense]|uniref:uncharacterized protein n=1 Tax=Annulohypoxylon maeteangense TaxID=1927788 RepID=UPI002007279C|nr:uncharacterized protein GGS22DRAFT_73862 [Annulohypoxylon maeteangense]KAI0881344.1 hypothetical protein GGS22DRAFT_73862 [Annulohypoxylon maeteangense]
MPPLLPRPTLLPRTLTRFLSTSAPRPSTQQRIPPESPLFINVPNPPQDQSIEALRELKPIRGHLPIPRQVFKHRDSHLKPRNSWLAQSAPKPTSAKSQQPPRSEIQGWKRRMAASRRENLRVGIRALFKRKQLTDKKRAERQAAKVALHQAAAAAPEREDERLTRASINPRTLETAVVLDPERFEKALASRERTTALLAQKSERRRDAIQELYMKARSFIVTESDLEAEVNKLFAPDYWKNMGLSASGFEVRNIWDLNGKPQTVSDMLNEVSRTSSTAVKSFETEKTRTLKRQKEVAEELTGGKLDGI